MRRLLPLATVTAATALVPSTALAAPCESRTVKADVTGDGAIHEAEFLGGGGPLGPRRLEVGEAAGRTLKGGRTYYVAAGTRARIRLGGYSYRLHPRAVFIPQCPFEGKGLYLRLLEGTVDVKGPRFAGNRSKGYAVTPEASFKPLPGRPDYRLTRKVTNRMKRTYSEVRARAGASNVFVTLHGPKGGNVPCQAGGSVKVFLDGRYRTG